MIPFTIPAHCNHSANSFVPCFERQRRFHRPVTIGGIYIGMARAGGLYLDKYLNVFRLRNWQFSEGQRLAELEGYLHCPNPAYP